MLLTLTILSLLPLAGATQAQEDRPAQDEATLEPVTLQQGEELEELGQDEPAAEPTTPVAVASEERERRLATLYEGTLLGMKDGEDFAETPAYRRLLEIVGSYGEGELAAKEPPAFDRAAALADPAALRGELVRVRGLLAGMSAERLAYPIAGRVDVFRAVVTDPNEGVVIDFLHAPPELELERDVVETEAVFVRMVGYENRKGERALAPYFVARDLRRFDADKAGRTTSLNDKLMLILLTAAVGYLVIRVTTTLRSKKGRGGDAERASRMLRERANAPLRPRPPAKS